MSYIVFFGNDGDFGPRSAANPYIVETGEGDWRCTQWSKVFDPEAEYKYEEGSYFYDGYDPSTWVFVPKEVIAEGIYWVDGIVQIYNTYGEKIWQYLGWDLYTAIGKKLGK